jgi:zinc/manganese transport system substrate-binding protein
MAAPTAKGGGPTPSGGARRARTALGTVALVAALAGCGSAARAPLSRTGPSDVISAVGAESQYANVLTQIGGRYVGVSSILNNPNTDPHTFESSPAVAREISSAQLIVQNGAGYDTFMSKMESTSSGGPRRVIVAQDVLGLPATTDNPHLWYDPRTMPAVAAVMAADLSALEPRHSSYFGQNLKRFQASLAPLNGAIARFRDSHPKTPAAVTEPVADYLLQAMGMRILTPFTFQADTMNGIDPSPQDISLEEGYLTQHRARVLCYNEQVADSLTATIRQTAMRSNVPVVGVYETMPGGYDFQSWMLAEVNAIQEAVTTGRSTQKL